MIETRALPYGLTAVIYLRDERDDPGPPPSPKSTKSAEASASPGLTLTADQARHLADTIHDTLDRQEQHRDHTV